MVATRSIYDRKLIAALPAGISVDRVGINRASVASQLGAISRGVPHPRFRFSSPDSIEEIRNQSARYDVAVISLEALESYADGLQCPALLILHNIHSDGLGQIDLLAVIVRCFSREMVEALGEKDIRTEKSCDWGAF